jgi:hypothetical protein
MVWVFENFQITSGFPQRSDVSWPVLWKFLENHGSGWKLVPLRFTGQSGFCNTWTFPAGSFLGKERKNSLLHWYEPLDRGLYGYVEVSFASEFSLVYLVTGQQYCVLAEVCKWIFCSTGQEALVCLSIWQWWATTNWCLSVGFYWTWFNIFISLVKFFVQHCCVYFLSIYRSVSRWTSEFFKPGQE